MKKLQFVLILLTLALCISTAYAQQGHFKIRSDEFIHVGYGAQKSITFGNQSTFNPNNGLYAIESWSGGLNFWKPWPNPQGYGNFVLYMRPDRNVGINTMGSSAYRLDVAGNVRAWSFIPPSDQRLKTNITPLSSSLDKILALDGVRYNYNFKLDNYENIDITKLTEAKQKSIEGDNFEGDATIHLGLLAQEVEKVVPEVVKADEKGILGVNYMELIPLLIESIKEQQEMIDDLEIEVLELKALLEEEQNSETNGNTKKSKLSDNSPNPFSNETKVAYNVSEIDATSNIYINVYNQKGSLVLTKRGSNMIGEQSVSISGQELKEKGTYFYSLVINGQVVDSKMMLYVASE